MTTMTVESAVRDRRSVHRFRPDALPESVLEDLLQTSTYAPNHKHSEPWRFVVVRGEAKQRLADLRVELVEERARAEGRPLRDPSAMIREIVEPQAIVYVVQQLSPDAKRQKEDYASCSIVAYILQLAAWERGLGARWHSGQLTSDPKVHAFLGLSEDEAATCYLAMGYPAEVPPDWQKKPAKDLTRYID